MYNWLCICLFVILFSKVISDLIFANLVHFREESIDVEEKSTDLVKKMI